METVTLTPTEIAAVFQEWKRRYDENPAGFISCVEFDAEAPATYGERASRYFQFVYLALLAGND